MHCFVENIVDRHFKPKPAVKPQAKYLAPRFTRGSDTLVEITHGLLYRVFFVLIVTLLVSTLGYVKADLPTPRHYVEDYANVINSSDKQSLNGVLQELEQKTGAQYIVLTVDTTGGLPIEQFAIELAEKWKLGQKGKDNGLLFVLAKNDRRWRFEVGYGLEGFVTDVYCSRIGRDLLVPYLKKGDYSQGI
ncbi:MAG: TPM domain-containing protein, partial [Sedimentisphaerales bacterium]